MKILEWSWSEFFTADLTMDKLIAKSDRGRISVFAVCNRTTYNLLCGKKQVWRINLVIKKNFTPGVVAEITEEQYKTMESDMSGSRRGTFLRQPRHSESNP